MMKPRVSVILPIYKQAGDITPSIGSILNQTLEDIEIIIVDNQTSDSNYEIAGDFAARDHRIKLVDEPRSGRSYILNSGLEQATADYVAILEPFDIAFPERLEKQVHFLDENPSVGLVASRARYVSTEDNSGFQFDYINSVNKLLVHEEISNCRFIETPLLHSTVCFRRELTETYGPYRHLPVPEDYELWLRWLNQGVKMHKLPDYLIEWRDVTGRQSPIDDQNCVQDYFEIISTYLKQYLLEHSPFGEQVVVWGAGRRSRQRFAILHELGYWPKFFIDMRGNEAKNVIQFKQTPPAGNHFILSYVSNREGRENVRQFLIELGYVEGKDFICVA